MKTITICGSMKFIEEMKNLKLGLEKKGFLVFIPDLNEGKAVDYDKLCINEKADMKKTFIDEHLEKIKKSDAIIVANYKKNDVRDYVGANSFLEMGFAYAFEKKIFLLNNVPSQANMVEILGLGPICLDGNLDYLETYL